LFYQDLSRRVSEMKVEKYFGDLDKDALKNIRKILKNPNDKRFLSYSIKLLSKSHNPKEVFSVIPQENFIEFWPKIRNYWKKIGSAFEFRRQWQKVYEMLVEKEKAQLQREGFSKDFSKIGNFFKEKRLKLGLTQKELALKIGMIQADISRIESGKRNITLETLIKLCKALKIKKIEL